MLISKRYWRAALGENSGALAMKLTSSKHIPGLADVGGSGIVTDQTTSLRNDGNNVDVDSEMSNVAENWPLLQFPY